ncbi:DUF3592 domain-containing protein [Jeongeupia naejangsanensis]|uniref:DUF3592 domain-containing protein n=1 Tax=Jeongeupia naejangsanensis TaxID=613195 RepID=A0ABS2BI30_9NEIS|nr:DUF3592 domain-containing protein [Jeongeupia naejangsanensis]MBM3115247.1 DUF3592 domain-containing protein [Jeongeupia naejangsanensis]
MTAFKYGFLITGLLLLLGCGMLLARQQYFHETASRAEGVVVDLYETYSDRRDAPSYKPVVRYLDSDGNEFEFTTTVATRPSAYDVGERVSVLYRPGQPDSATLDNGLEQGTGLAILAFFGIACSGIGGVLIWATAREKQRQTVLEQNGKRIQASYLRTDVLKASDADDEDAFRIVVQWRDPASKERILFLSPRLRNDPSHHLKNGQSITVLVDLNKLDNYQIDLLFLTQSP